MINKIIKILSEKFGIDESRIVSSTNLRNDLALDSLDFFELIVALEKEFDIDINIEDLETINTIEDVINYLKGKGIS